MLELAILGLLKRQPMHGYDLRKRLRGDVGLLSSLSFGSLYPALARLEREGAVREVDAAPSSPPADAVAVTGSLAGERAAFRARLAARAAGGPRPARTSATSRTRKVYELTPLGEQLFEQLLTDDRADANDGKDGKAFALRWAFARHLTPEGRIRLLERRKRQLEDRRAAAGRTAQAPLRPLDRFERSLVEHSLSAIDFELAWVDGLIATERRSRPDGRLLATEPAPDVASAATNY